jgi:hypothetical protein
MSTGSSTHRAGPTRSVVFICLEVHADEIEFKQRAKSPNADVLFPAPALFILYSFLPLLTLSSSFYSLLGRCAFSRLFCFLALFSKDSLKYAPCGKISKNGPFSWRHSRRRQAIMAWRQALWRQDPADVAMVAMTWQCMAPWILAPCIGANVIGAMPWRHRSWRQEPTF